MADIPGYDAYKLASPPEYDGYPSEQCDGGNHDLYEPVMRYSWGYVARNRERIGGTATWCNDCRQKFSVSTRDQEWSMGHEYWNLTMINRCDECHHFRCTCP